MLVTSTTCRHLLPVSMPSLYYRTPGWALHLHRCGQATPLILEDLCSRHHCRSEWLPISWRPSFCLRAAGSSAAACWPAGSAGQSFPLLAPPSTSPDVLPKIRGCDIVHRRFASGGRCFSGMASPCCWSHSRCFRTVATNWALFASHRTTSTWSRCSLASMLQPPSNPQSLASFFFSSFQPSWGCWRCPWILYPNR